VAPSASRALSGWRARLASDPIPRLLREGSPSILARVRRDLMGDSEAPTAKEIAKYPEVTALLGKIEPNGGFVPKAADKALGGPRFAAALATIRALDRLADLGLSIEGDGDDGPSPLHKVADFLLSSQKADGGIADLALAETPHGRAKAVAIHYQGWALGVLCRCGFEFDRRVQKGFQYLLARRQDDGGWAWRGVRTNSAARPSSHLVTGMVLRAFAASTEHIASREARRAVELLATRVLQPDRYEDRKSPSYWQVLAEPRFYTDVLDALDTVTAIGLGKENSGVRTAEAYLRTRQGADGLWVPGAAPKAGRGGAGTRFAAPKGQDKGQDSGSPNSREREKLIETALWITLRVLVVLRRIN
jgi:hypothetical protein